MSTVNVINPFYVIGDAWDLTVTIPNETKTGPFDLTDCTVLFTLKRKADVARNDDAAFCKLSWVDGGASSGIAVVHPGPGFADSGVATITVPASATALLSPDYRHKYDVRVINAGGEPKTVVIVEFTPVLGVTERTS